MFYIAVSYNYFKQISKAASRGCAIKKVFLETLQNLQEGTHAGVCLSKVIGWRLVTLLKRYSSTGVSSEFCEIFKNINFAKYLEPVVSEI